MLLSFFFLRWIPLHYLRCPFVGEHVRDKSKTVDSEGNLKELADKVSNTEAEVQILEEEYKKDLLDHDKVCSSRSIALYLSAQY